MDRDEIIRHHVTMKLHIIVCRLVRFCKFILYHKSLSSNHFLVRQPEVISGAKVANVSKVFFFAV